MVVLGIEQVDGFEVHRFSFELLRDVLDVVPDRVDVLVRLAWVDSCWFGHCSTTMLNIEEQSFDVCSPLVLLIRRSITIDAH